MSAKARLKELQMTQKGLAKEISRTPAYVSGLLSGRYDTSCDIDAISELLGLEAPATAPANSKVATITAALNEKDDAELEKIRAILALVGDD